MGRGGVGVLVVCSVLVVFLSDAGSSPLPRVLNRITPMITNTITAMSVIAIFATPEPPPRPEDAGVAAREPGPVPNDGWPLRGS